MTAKLSKHFYDQLGEQTANELVEWFNQVDATYRADLRELNELNFARFDAKVSQQFAEQDLRIERRFAEFAVQVERRFAESEAQVRAMISDLRAEVFDRIARSERNQMQLLLATWGVLFAAVVGLYAR